MRLVVTGVSNQGCLGFSAVDRWLEGGFDGLPRLLLGFVFVFYHHRIVSGCIHSRSGKNFYYYMGV